MRLRRQARFRRFRVLADIAGLRTALGVGAAGVAATGAALLLSGSRA